jgi:hypothetical protein
MTIEEIKEKKKQLEKNVLGLLSKFEDETKCAIYDLDLEFEQMFMHEDYDSRVVNVRIRAKL